MATPAPKVGRPRRGPLVSRRAAVARLLVDDLEQCWEQVPLGLAIVDERLRIVRVNDSLARLLGRPREQLVDGDLPTAAEALGTPTVDACRAALRSDAAVTNLQFSRSAARTGGADTALTITVRPLRRRAGELRRLALIVEDATRQQELQESLDGRLRFEQLIANLLARFADIADDAVQQAIGSGLEDLGHFLDVDRITLSEADHETFRVLHSWAVPGIAPIPRTFNVADMPWYVEQLRQGHTVRVARSDDLPPDAWRERQIMERMGTRSHLAIPLRAGDGVVGSLALGAIRHPREWPDVLVGRLRLLGQLFATALGRKNANERLARQQQELAHVGRVAAVGELAAILAHDLRQPLTAILTNAQATRRMIERRQDSPHDTDEALSDMADDATRAGAIIQRLRALLRRGEPSLSAVDVNRLLADVEPIVAAELREFEVALELELSQGLPPVKGDAVQLQQVLLNLLSNACHAMSTLAREQRKLIIRTWRALDPLEEDMVLLDVCDAGPPVAADVFERIFEPFFTTKSTGLGMGLAITRSIIAAHHGRVWATRNATRGITVHVTLPVCR